MSLSLNGTKSALAAALKASFLASGGTAPYVYSVTPGGAGGTINSITGLYTAPAALPSDPAKAYDTVLVTDALMATASLPILVGSPLLLFCEILKRELQLDDSHIFLWDQKSFQPTDFGLYLIVSDTSPRVISNRIGPSASSGWADAVQSITMVTTLDIDIISRGPAARDRKEEILLALNSLYSEAQQEANSFSIAKMPPGARFQNLSFIDGAAIPYRYKISVNMTYAVTKSKAAEYFDTFQNVEVTADP